jgi:hypothetical protein
LIMMAAAHRPEKTELLEPGVKISGFIRCWSKMTLRRGQILSGLFQTSNVSEMLFIVLPGCSLLCLLPNESSTLARIPGDGSKDRRGVAFGVVAPAGIDAWNYFRC